MTQKTMKAVTFNVGGKANEVLQVREIDVPAIGSTEVLVKMEARPLQPADFMFIGDRYRIKPQFPQVAGLEGTGVIKAAGSQSRFKPGQRVAFRHPGTWAEYACVPDEKLYLVPPDVKPESAAQFALNPVTAYGLLDELNVRAGDWIVINAAGSAVARMVASLAKRQGVNVIGIVRNPRNYDLPYPVVAADTPGIAAAALEKTGNVQIAGLLDCIGGEAIKSIMPTLRQGGVIVSYGVLEQTPIQLTNADMIYKNLTWKGFGVDHWLSRTDAAKQVNMVINLWSAIQDKAAPLPLDVKAQYPLEQVLAAVNAATTEGPGKVILV